MSETSRRTARAPISCHRMAHRGAGRWPFFQFSCKRFDRGVYSDRSLLPRGLPRLFSRLQERFDRVENGDSLIAAMTRNCVHNHHLAAG
jgi:hypothetical protein